MCGIQYIGKSTAGLQRIMPRIIASIHNNKMSKLATHFNENNHKIDNISIQPIDRVDCNNNQLNVLTQKTYTWISIMNTAEPNGLNNTRATQTGFTTCNTKRCVMCMKYSTDSQKITNSIETFKINNKLTCTSTNTIYVITCNKCKVQYVGETSQTIRDRLTHHISNIRTRKNTPISIHFNTNNHDITDVRILPIDQIEDSTERKRLEKQWMITLDTIYPKGLNFMPLIR